MARFKKKNPRSSQLQALILFVLALSLCFVYSAYETSGFFVATSGERSWVSLRNIAPTVGEVSGSSKPYETPPPEPLDIIEFCAEKCRYIPEMCTENRHQNVKWPGVDCKVRFLDVESDLYWQNKTAYWERTLKTIKLTTWGAIETRKRMQGAAGKSACETGLVKDMEEIPMMFPEEMELMVKMLLRKKPKTYLEWGSGKSTSFYPLLVSGQVRVIDNYPPWCAKVQQNPVVKCMIKEQKRLKYNCVHAKLSNGSNINVVRVGHLINEEEIVAMREMYVREVDNLDIKRYDVALVDGRFRADCALKLLHYLDEDSVLVMHDFFIRSEYHPVFKYYDVIGYARSLVLLRKKPPQELPKGWEVAFKDRNVLTTDIADDL